MFTSRRCWLFSAANFWGFLFFVHRYFSILRRHNYVTPTSYLELIQTFKSLLRVKREETMALKNRYIIGLEKLEFAASQVSVMKDELIALRPKLVETSAETEKLMEKIAQDTVEVEAKKEASGVCFCHRCLIQAEWLKKWLELEIKVGIFCLPYKKIGFGFVWFIDPSISSYKDFIQEHLH